MSYGLYVLGAVIVIVGLVYGAVLLRVPTPWLGVITLVLLGLAVLSGVKQTRERDHSR